MNRPAMLTSPWPRNDGHEVAMTTSRQIDRAFPVPPPHRLSVTARNPSGLQRCGAHVQHLPSLVPRGHDGGTHPLSWLAPGSPAEEKKMTTGHRTSLPRTRQRDLFTDNTTLTQHQFQRRPRPRHPTILSDCRADKPLHIKEAAARTDRLSGASSHASPGGTRGQIKQETRC